MVPTTLAEALTQGSAPQFEVDIDALLEKLSLEEQISLLIGGDDFTTLPIERLGIPALKVLLPSAPISYPINVIQLTVDIPVRRLPLLPSSLAWDAPLRKHHRSFPIFYFPCRDLQPGNFEPNRTSNGPGITITRGKCVSRATR